MSLTLSETLPLFFLVSLCSALIEGAIMYVAFIKQKLNFKLTPTPLLYLSPGGCVLCSYQRHDGNASLARK